MKPTSNGLLFLLTRYLQSVLGHSAVEAGIMLLPHEPGEKVAI